MEELLTIKELAKVLKIDESWIYSRTHKNGQGIKKGQRPIPHVRIGKYLRFKLPAVMKWIEKQYNSGEIND